LLLARRQCHHQRSRKRGRNQ